MTDSLGMGKRSMVIGIPKELKVAEKRVAITPAGVRTLMEEAHTILIEAGAGLGSGFSDESYVRAGGELRRDSADIWTDAEMVLKVKEPPRSWKEVMNSAIAVRDRGGIGR